MCSKDVDEIANSVDPDQTAPLDLSVRKCRNNMVLNLASFIIMPCHAFLCFHFSPYKEVVILVSGHSVVLLLIKNASC